MRAEASTSRHTERVLRHSSDVPAAPARASVASCLLISLVSLSIAIYAPGIKTATSCPLVHHSACHHAAIRSYCCDARLLIMTSKVESAPSLYVCDDTGWSAAIPAAPNPPLVLGRGSCNIDMSYTLSATQHSRATMRTLSCPADSDCSRLLCSLQSQSQPRAAQRAGRRSGRGEGRQQLSTQRLETPAAAA